MLDFDLKMPHVDLFIKCHEHHNSHNWFTIRQIVKERDNTKEQREISRMGPGSNTVFVTRHFIIKTIFFYVECAEIHSKVPAGILAMPQLKLTKYTV